MSHNAAVQLKIPHIHARPYIHAFSFSRQRSDTWCSRRHFVTSKNTRNLDIFQWPAPGPVSLPPILGHRLFNVANPTLNFREAPFSGPFCEEKQRPEVEGDFFYESFITFKYNFWVEYWVLEAHLKTIL